jgi:hypothetical protein
MPEMTITLNGTDTNPWHRWGLKLNPFPQLAKAEYAEAELMVASLDGDPIKDADDIRQRLAGCDPKFIEGVVARFKPGQRVRFTISFPDPHLDGERDE